MQGARRRCSRQLRAPMVIWEMWDPFSFAGWNYDVQVTSGSRAIYRLNDQATFKVHLLSPFFSGQILQLGREVRMQQGGAIPPC